MNEQIIIAHNNWRKVEATVPQYEYEKGYKSRSAKARKLWRVFSQLCEAEGLKPVQVAHSLLPPSSLLFKG